MPSVATETLGALYRHTCLSGPQNTRWIFLCTSSGGMWWVTRAQCEWGLWEREDAQPRRIPNCRVGGREAWPDLSKNNCPNSLCHGIRWAGCASVSGFDVFIKKNVSSFSSCLMMLQKLRWYREVTQWQSLTLEALSEYLLLLFQASRHWNPQRHAACPHQW